MAPSSFGPAGRSGTTTRFGIAVAAVKYARSPKQPSAGSEEFVNRAAERPPGFSHFLSRWALHRDPVRARPHIFDTGNQRKGICRGALSCFAQVPA